MAGDAGVGFTFALPPSLGTGPVERLAIRFAEVLEGAGFGTVMAMPSYGDLERALLEGSVDAAWGPPIVCARVESAGGRVALRAVRYGAVTYRSVLICRLEDPLDLRVLVGSGRRLRAAWVDRWSMGGYVLPRHHLRSRGIEPDVALDEAFAGSYRAGLDRVLEGEAELTASYANRRGLGYVDICGPRAEELRTLAYTAESPNDGVVLSPKLPRARAEALLGGLHRLIATPASLAILAETFEVDGFDRPPLGTYQPLLAYL